MSVNRIVTVAQGKLQGIPGRDGSVTVFRGVPYAQPPVGPLRWRTPQPPCPGRVFVPAPSSRRSRTRRRIFSSRIDRLRRFTVPKTAFI